MPGGAGGVGAAGGAGEVGGAIARAGVLPESAAPPAESVLTVAGPPLRGTSLLAIADATKIPKIGGPRIAPANAAALSWDDVRPGLCTTARFKMKRTAKDAISVSAFGLPR